MRPSQRLGPRAPATDDPRRWLRVLLVRTLVVLANAVTGAVLLHVLRR